MALTTNIVSYWSFDSSNSNDSTGNGLNGTDTSITYSTGNGKISVGAGATNGLITNTSASFQLSTASVSCWVKSSGFGASYRVIAICNQRYSLYAKDNVLISFDWGASLDRSTGVNIADGNWHHVVITYDSGVANGSHLYIDGSNSLTFTCTNGGAAGNFKLFSDGVGSQNSACSIDEVGVWSRTLTSSEVTQLYNGGAGLQYPFTTSTLGAGFLMAMMN